MDLLRKLGRSSTPHAGRPSRVTVLVAVLVAAVLSGCGRSDAAGTRVVLLPDRTVTGQSWEWTAGCQFAPVRPGGCRAAGPNLRSAQLTGDAWNLGQGGATTGSVGMSVSPTGTWAMKGDLTSAPPCTSATCIAPSANTWVRGYPSVLYGINQCNAATSPPESPKLPLPMAVGSIPSDLVATTAYASDTPDATYDIAYDMWLNPSDTKSPCRTDGTVEVMVWTDYDAKALLPDSLRVGTTSIPFAVNGTENPGTHAWSVYASDVYRTGQTVPWGGTVWLVPDQADVVSQGKMTVDLSAALDAVGTLLQNNYGWSNFQRTYWLDTIAFGMEFGPQSGDPYGRGSTQFSLNLTSYCFGVAATLKSTC